MSIGTKSYGQAAGDYVFTQSVSTDSLWATVGNWGVSDGAGGTTAAVRTPGATDNVWIAAGNRMGVIPTSITNSACQVAANSKTVTLTAANLNIKAGMAVRNTDNFYGIAPGTFVESVSVDGITVTLSQPATRALTKLSYFPACKNLNVNGTFRVSAQFVAFGVVLINSTAVLFQNSDFYCPNITNSGLYIGIGGYRSGKSLYFGFNGAVPGTGDYTLINDGIFGDTAPKVPQGTTGGVKLLYSNQANSITIKPSSPTVTGYAFNIAQILPQSNMKTTANTNLNIKESMSLLIHNGIGLSVQNTDTCTGTTRTCTIDPGVTVYVGYRFHSGGPTTNDQGNFVYNVYGTLDMGTYGSPSNNTTASAANTSDFNLSLSSVSGNAGSLTFNLGDGTQTNPGTLILGSNLKLVKQRTQSIIMNFNDYSTVNVLGNYGWTMNYQLLNSNVPALYLFPKSFYNLTLSGAKSILPVAPVIRNNRSYISGIYGTTNWVASTPGTTTIATSLYNTTTATGLPQGSVLFTGSAYYYVPVVRSTSTYSSGTNPITLAGDTIMKYITLGQYASGNNITLASSAVNAISGNNVTLATAPSPSSTQTNVFVQFYGIQGTTAPTGTSSDTNNPVFDGGQPLIYLGDTNFGINITTGIKTVEQKTTVSVYSNERNRLEISNATAGDMATVYSVSGTKVASAKLTADKMILSIGSGIYLVKINDSVAKVVVR